MGTKTIIIKFARKEGQVYVYDDGQMIASYWDVVGLVKAVGKHDNKWEIITRNVGIVGRVTGKARIKEKW